MNLSDIAITVDRDHAQVTLRGEHEAFTAHKLGRRLEALLDEAVPIEVDLRHTTFIDSTVVGALLAAKRRADHLGLDFILALGDETGWPVRRLLEVTGLDATFVVVG